MQDRVINFGIVGCGMIARVHASAILEIENATLYGVSDITKENALRFANEYSVKAFDSYEKMLECDYIDAVIICTPSLFHAEMAIKALNANKHVIIEKPMALNEESANDIIKAQAKSKKKLTVISQLRLEEDVIKVKNLVKENAFGRISLVRLSMKYVRTPEYYNSSSWRGTLKYDGGGALMNQGIHGIDMLTYIMGEVKDVKGKVRTLVHDIEVEDTAVAVLEFESGVLGTIEASTCAYPGFDRRIEIHGDKGYVYLKENVIEKLMIDGKEIEIKNKEHVSTSSNPKSTGIFMHKRQIVNFINAILGKEELISNCYDGKRAVKIIKDIYKSND